MKLSLNKKSGFISNDKKIRIYDEKGEIFYLFNNTKGLLHFNLPLGNYYTDNNIKQVEPKKFLKKYLPKGRRYKKVPDKLNVIFTENPNKVSVDTSSNMSYFDNEFKNAPKACFDLAYCHELGHYKFFNAFQRSEKQCDTFAYNCLLEHGYNPSQIKFALNTMLSNSQKAQARKNNI